MSTNLSTVSSTAAAAAAAAATTISSTSPTSAIASLKSANGNARNTVAAKIPSVKSEPNIKIEPNGTSNNGVLGGDLSPSSNEHEDGETDASQHSSGGETTTPAAAAAAATTATESTTTSEQTTTATATATAATVATSTSSTTCNTDTRDMKWIFPMEKIVNSPSRRDGISMEQELSEIQDAALFINELGSLLKLNQLCMNTAIIYMHRFYMVHSLKKFQRYVRVSLPRLY